MKVDLCEKNDKGKLDNAALLAETRHAWIVQYFVLFKAWVFGEH
jgi:hypothetical protein